MLVEQSAFQGDYDENPFVFPNKSLNMIKITIGKYYYHMHYVPKTITVVLFSLSLRSQTVSAIPILWASLPTTRLIPPNLTGRDPTSLS